MRLHHLKFLRLRHALDATVWSLNLHDFILIRNVGDHLAALLLASDEAGGEFGCLRPESPCRGRLPSPDWSRALLVDPCDSLTLIHGEVERHRVARIRVETRKWPDGTAWAGSRAAFVTVGPTSPCVAPCASALCGAVSETPLPGITGLSRRDRRWILCCWIRLNAIRD